MLSGGQWYLPSPCSLGTTGEINGDYVINATMAADVRMIKDEEAGSYPGGNVTKLWCRNLAAPFTRMASTHIVVSAR